MTPSWALFEEMADCIICGKPVRQGATVCSTTCMIGQKTGKGSKGKPAPISVASIIGNLQQTALERGIQLQEVPMIALKHRWMRNRNMVQDGVVFSFGADGVARIPDLGNNYLAAQNLVKFGKGLIEFEDDTPKVEAKDVAGKGFKPIAKEPEKEAPAPAPKAKETKKSEEPKKKVLEPEPKVEVSSKEEEVVTSAKSVKKKSTKKTPAKKASSKKK